MKMLEKDFKHLLDEYVEGEDVVITNARGFWETAPKMKCLIMNVGTHILLKYEDLISLKPKLQNKFLHNLRPNILILILP